MSNFKGIQLISAPFPGYIGRPSTYKEPVTEIFQTHKTNPVTVKLGPDVIKQRAAFGNKEGKTILQPVTSKTLRTSNVKFDQERYDRMNKWKRSKPELVDYNNGESVNYNKGEKIFITVEDDRDIMEKYSDLVSRASSSNIIYEIELKFQGVNQALFNKIHEVYPGELIPTIEEIDDHIRKINGTYTISFLRKTKLFEEVKGLDKISVSSEEVLKPVSKFNPTITRNKQRYRSIVGPNEEYYLDLTIVTTNNTTDDKRKSTYEIELELIVGKPIPTLQEFTDFALMIRSVASMDDSFSDLQKLLNTTAPGTSSILTQVVPLTPKSYYKTFYSNLKNGYYVTDKPDGLRCLVYVVNSQEYVYSNPKILISESDVDVKGTYVLDCERHKDNLVVIDVVYPPVSGNVKDRLNTLPVYYKNKKKPYVLVKSPTDIEKAVTDLYVNKSEIDGLIFATTDQSYHTTNVMKWKPVEQQTIDLGLRSINNGEYLIYSRIQAALATILGFPKVKGLTPSTYGQDYVEVPFSPSVSPFIYKFTTSNEYDDGIYEMLPSSDMKSLSIVRPRPDKKNPNDHKVAETVFNSQMNPLTLQMLWNISNNEEYFDIIEPNKNEYTDYLSAMRNITSKLLYAQAKQCLGLGEGRGSDINKYRIAGIRKMICQEISGSALSELCTRKYTTINSKQNYLADTVIYASHSDARSADLVSICKGFRMSTVDRITSNFAAHYFMAKDKTAKHMLSQAKQLLTEGGKFMFIVLDDEKISNNGNEHGPNDDDIIKTLNFGSKFKINVFDDGSISVKVPFKTVMIKEDLVKTYLMETLATKYDFKYEKYELSLESSAKLSRDERDYVLMHCCHIFTKQ